MTTYRTIASSEVDHNSPVTATLMAALKDNPTAITEGASGAPRIVNGALDTSLNSASVVVSGGPAIFYITLGPYAFFPSVGTVPSGVTVGLGSSTTENGDLPVLRVEDAATNSATISVEWRAIDA